jgi:hypothetical protein
MDILNVGRPGNTPSQGRNSDVVYLVDRANRGAPSKLFRARLKCLERLPVRFVLVQWFVVGAGFSTYHNRFDVPLAHPQDLDDDKFAGRIRVESLLIYENEDEVGFVSTFAATYRELVRMDPYPGIKTGAWSKAKSVGRPNEDDWADVFGQLRHLTQTKGGGFTVRVAAESYDGANIGRVVRYDAGTTNEVIQVNGFEDGPTLPKSFEASRVATLLARLERPYADK